MPKQQLKLVLLFILALVFSTSLMFAFIELPRIIDATLQNVVGFPGFDHGLGEQNTYKSELYINALHLRWIGYVCLILVLVFIVLGFVTQKSGWAWAGALTLFLPVFGQFALSMFFLAGLGILRVGWLPFLDISFQILEMGNVIYLPYWMLMWFFGLFDWYAHTFLSYFFMGLGSVLFVWGVLAWFQARFQDQSIAIDWIYKFSRHPQYLGWIVWSFGLLLYAPTINTMKKTWSVPSSLPWLLATMVIIGICLLEEIKMRKRYGDRYEQYRRRTPFLFPLPKWITIVLKMPSRLLFRKEWPQTKGEVAGFTTLYTVLLIGLSLIWVDFRTEKPETRPIATQNPQQTVDSLLVEIYNVPHRRYIHIPFNHLIALDSLAIKPLISLLSDPDPVIREFAAEGLGEMEAQEAIDPLLLLLDDPAYRARNAATSALGKIGSEEALPVLLVNLEQTSSTGFRNFICGALGNIGSREAWIPLINVIQDSVWYNRIAAINALNKIDPDQSWPYVFASLKDSNANVKRNAVMLILAQKPSQAREALIYVLDDEDFETRFYSRQALKMLEDN
jgi:protein-S-isoprenylcysteine O-methyltransferase Ste14